jgi:hypothetical protein
VAGDAGASGVVVVVVCSRNCATGFIEVILCDQSSDIYSHVCVIDSLIYDKHNPIQILIQNARRTVKSHPNTYTEFQRD